jgi:hypothetical protein
VVVDNDELELELDEVSLDARVVSGLVVDGPTVVSVDGSSVCTRDDDDLLA